MPPEKTHHHVVVEVEHFDAAIGLMADRLTETRDSQLTRADVSEAMADAIRNAFSDPKTWCGAGEGLRLAAEVQAGPWLVKAILRWTVRTMILCGVGVVIYQFGGWTALAAAWKAFGGSNP